MEKMHLVKTIHMYSEYNDKLICTLWKRNSKISEHKKKIV